MDLARRGAERDGTNAKISAYGGVSSLSASQASGLAPRTRQPCQCQWSLVASSASAPLLLHATTALADALSRQSGSAAVRAAALRLRSFATARLTARAIKMIDRAWG
jgi:hypothetical protein